MMYNYILVYSNSAYYYRYYNLKDKTAASSYDLHELIAYIQNEGNYYVTLKGTFNYETIEFMVNNGDYNILVESTTPITPKYYPELFI